MSSYSPDLGFSPSNAGSLMAEFKAQIESIFGVTYDNDEQFLGSNFYQLFLAFATKIMDTENEVIKVIDTFFNWANTLKESLNTAKSGTYFGFTNAAKDYASDFSFTCHFYNPEIPAGVALLAFHNPAQNLSDLFKAYFPIGVATYKDSSTPPSQSVDVTYDNGQTLTYYYENSHLIELDFRIRYRKFNRSIAPADEVQLIIDGFIDRFNKVQKLGMDLEPEFYLSSTDFDFVADFVLEHKPKGANESEYSSVKKSAEYYDLFAIAKDDSGSYNVEVLEDKGL